MPTDLRSKLHDLALTYASEIVTAVRSSPLRELFESAPADMQIGRVLAASYGLSGAEADVLRRALKPRIERLRLLAAKPPDDATRYAMGAVIKELKSDPDTFGESAVSTAAAAIGEDQATLYRFASVAERWTASQVRTLLAGKALSWSHLVALARVEQPAVRAQLIRKAQQARMPLRELQVLINRAMK